MTKQLAELSLQTAEPEYAAFVAIDWADRKHYWSLYVPGEGRREHGELKHSPEAIETWMMELAQRFPERPIAVCLEQSRGALLACLSKYERLVLYPIHPGTAKDFRKALYPSGKKSDPADADVLLGFLLSHRDRLRPWQPDTEQTRELQLLVEDRRCMVDEKTRHLNRLTQRLKLYFPQALDWFGSADSQLLWQFLARWGDLESVQGVRRSTLETFLNTDRRLHPPRIDTLWSDIQNAIPATHDQAIIRTAVRCVRSLVRQLQVMRETIREYEQRIDELTKTHPDFPIVSSFPAVGQALAPRLIVAMGTQRDRFAIANEVQSFAGIAPVREASGKQCWIHVRRACSKFVRQTFQEWAQHSIKFCPWARAYYEQQRARGKQHHAAVRGLAFKWIRILFRCWKDRAPYDDAKYGAALKRRSGHPTQPVEFVCENQAGFSKLARKKS